MNIGGLTIEMMADMARLRQDMDSVKSMVGGAMEDVAKAVDLAKTAFVALAGVGSVAAFANMIKGAIDGAEALHDLSLKSGASVEALSALVAVGKTTGTSADTIAGAMNKLAKSTADLDENGKGAAQAMRALGIDFDEFNRLSPDQKLVQVAKSMDGFADGTGKSQAAMALLGKSGAELLPYLKDLADTGELQAKITSEQAAQADRFNDNLTMLQASGQGWKKELAMGLLPALSEFSQAMLDVLNGTGGLRDEVKKLSADGTLADWTRTAITGFTYLLDATVYVKRGVEVMGEGIGAWVASLSAQFGGFIDAIRKALSGDFSGAWDSIQSGMRQSAAVMREFGADAVKAFSEETVGGRIRERMSELKGVAVAVKDNREQLDFHAAATDKDAKAVENAMKAGHDYLSMLSKSVAEAEKELEVGRKLTEAEKMTLDLMEKLNSGKMKLTAAEQAEAKAKIAVVAAAKEEFRWIEETTKENQKAIDAVRKHADAISDQVVAQQEATFRLGMNVEALQRHEVAAIRDKAALAGRNAELVRAANADMAAQYDREAAALYKLAESRDRFFDKQAAVQAASAWQGFFGDLSDGIVNALVGGGTDGWKQVLHMIEAQAIKMTIVPIVQEGVGLIGAAIGNMLGLSSVSGGANGLLSTLNGAQTATNLYGALTGYSQGVNSLAGLLGAGSTAGASSLSLGYANAVGAAGGDSLGALIAANGSWAGVDAGAAAGGTAAAGGGTSALGSMGAYAGYAALIAAAVMLAESLYSKGYTGSDKIGTDGAAGTLYTTSVEGLTTRGLKSLGLSDKWAEILGGSVRMNWTMDKLGMLSTPHVGGYSLASADGVQDITKQQGGIQNTAMQGWTDSFASDMLKLMTGVAKDFGVESSAAAVRAVYESDSRDGSWGLFHILDQAGKTIAGRDSLGTLDKDPAKGFEQYTASAAGAIVDALAQLDLPKWAKDELAKLTDASTLQDLGTKIAEIEAYRAALDGISDSLQPYGGIFDKLALSSSDARNTIVQLSGGLDAFTQKASDYISKYYSSDEQMAVQARHVLDQANAMGLSIGDFGKRADLRAMMDAFDPEKDAEKIASLLNLAGTFANIGDYLEKNQTTLQSLASQAPASAALDTVTPQQVTADSTKKTADEVTALRTEVQGLRDDFRNTVSALNNIESSLQSMSQGDALAVRTVA